MEGLKVEKGIGQPPKKPVRYHYRGSNGAGVKDETNISFQGRCEDLKGHIFDCVDGRHADQYAVTMKEIAAYIGTKYTYGADIRWSLEHEKVFVVPKLTKLDTTADEFDKRIWEKEVDEYVKRKSKHESNCRTLFSLIHGQCTEYLKAKLEALVGFPAMKENFDVFELIKAIKGVTFKLEDNKYHLEALHDAKIRFYTLRQGKDMDKPSTWSCSRRMLQSLNSSAGQSQEIQSSCYASSSSWGLTTTVRAVMRSLRQLRTGKKSTYAWPWLRALTGTGTAASWMNW
jgi:hypothetical protein